MRKSNTRLDNGVFFLINGMNGCGMTKKFL